MNPNQMEGNKCWLGVSVASKVFGGSPERKTREGKTEKGDK